MRGGAIVIIFSDVTKYDYIVLHNIIKNVMSILVGETATQIERTPFPTGGAWVFSLTPFPVGTGPSTHSGNVRGELFHSPYLSPPAFAIFTAAGSINMCTTRYGD